MYFDSVDADIFQFQAYRDLSGAVQTVTLCRRNGRPAACFGPSFFPTSLFEDLGDETELPREIFANLTKTEAQTWLRILEGASLGIIADEQGVSRAAVYERIRGNSKGQGGMVTKNRWVACWWKTRIKQRQQL